MLQQRFNSFIEKQSLVQSNQKVLLAVSGGIDSVVMANLFRVTGLNFAIAHCNFKLRGEDSDKDEAFVKNLTEELSVPFFTASFNTLEQSGVCDESIQMTARRLRYEWLEHIRKENNYNLVATAHHHDDNIETWLINILRGTGIHGLRGIPLKNRNVIRPLLFATKQDIKQYAEKHKIKYRTDHSNKENKYLRNILRNNVIPVFEKINPGFRNNFKELFKNIELPYNCFLDYIEETKKELLIKDNERFIIPLKKVKQLKHPATVLYELLKKYGFNKDTIYDIVTSFEKQPGKMFHGSGYSLVKDRDCLILYPEKKNEPRESTHISDKPEHYCLPCITLKTEVFDVTSDLTFPKKEQFAYLDFDKLQFPLKLRPWQKGDTFQPLGMHGKKKVSDFLIDKKVSIDKKKKVYVLCSGEKIVWVAGYRIDERFKIDKSSKKCFFIKFAV